MPVAAGNGAGPGAWLPNHLLVNQLLPVLRATHLPLLPVPEAAPAGLAVAAADLVPDNVGS